jgi:CheY-like chemotaxis protein
MLRVAGDNARPAAEVSTAPLTLPGATAGARAPRVLLAEDHPTNRKVVELILGAAGVELISVENGAEALQAAGEQSFDVILMDMQMPVMDGLSAIRAIRANERLQGAPPTPIVALTANAMPEHARASRVAGATDHVTKPVSAKVLLEAVARAVAGEAADGLSVSA